MNIYFNGDGGSAAAAADDDDSCTLVSRTWMQSTLLREIRLDWAESELCSNRRVGAANFPVMHSCASLSELVPNIQVHKLRDSTEVLICQIIGLTD